MVLLVVVVTGRRQQLEVVRMCHVPHTGSSCVVFVWVMQRANSGPLTLTLFMQTWLVSLISYLGLVLSS